jgi:hypothetical protein
MSDDGVPTELAPPVYGIPTQPTESSKKGEHSLTEDIEEESVSEWEIERQQEKVHNS